MIVELYAKKSRFFRRIQWRARIIADNGDILLVSSESYDNRGDLLHALTAVAENLRGLAVRTIYADGRQDVDFGLLKS